MKALISVLFEVRKSRKKLQHLRLQLALNSRQDKEVDTTVLSN